jgi:hypothetical protein
MASTSAATESSRELTRWPYLVLSTVILGLRDPKEASSFLNQRPGRCFQNGDGLMDTAETASAAVACPAWSFSTAASLICSSWNAAPMRALSSSVVMAMVEQVDEVGWVGA